jgi:large subunit ribosomal protein L18
MTVRSRKVLRKRRHVRIRQKISGTAERPRMCIMISNKHLYVQFVDDEKGVTLAAASDLKEGVSSNMTTAAKVGKTAAETAITKGIRRVVVDRSGYAYHGKIKAVVESAISAGLSL